MCNRYQLRTNLHSICRELGVQSTLDFEVPAEVFPYTLAPVLAINRDGDRELRPMTFGMGDRDGSSSRRAHVLNNARIESRSKWPWKTSFEKYRCVVPMTSFREACYWGETAGTEVSFEASDGQLLLAAGIFSFHAQHPDDPGLKMSVIMRPALPFVMEHGHHRSPFFIRPEGLDQWMQRTTRSADESIEVLRRFAAAPDLKCEVDRHMAASWTKRKATNLKQRDEQLIEIQQTGPMGFR